MTSHKHERFSTQELIERRQKLSKVNYGILSIMILYGISMVYQMINGSWNSKSPMIILPIILFVALLLNNVAKKRITEEIATRPKT